MIALLAVAVFASSALVDFAHARYAAARDERRPHASARWSVLQWSAATVGFVVAARVTLWALPAEAAGLYVGTILASRRID